MSVLLPVALQNQLPNPCGQEGNKDPTVHAVFYFPLGGWIWFATEGRPVEGDFLFFGYVIGLERELGYFCLSELESVDINGIKVCRVEDHQSKRLSKCLLQYRFEEN